MTEMRKLKAFCLGLLEFRSDWTTHFTDYDELVAYDHGRELAHRITFRRFEQ
jgi:hypothetical protein